MGLADFCQRKPYSWIGEKNAHVGHIVPVVEQHTVVSEEYCSILKQLASL